MDKPNLVGFNDHYNYLLKKIEALEKRVKQLEMETAVYGKN